MSRGETFRDRNSITNDLLVTKPASEAYLENYDKIFRKDKQTETDLDSDKESEEKSE